MILSQNEDTMVNIDRVFCLRINKTHAEQKGFVINADKETLGIYDSEERAKKVLKDIYRNLRLENFSFTYEMPKK